VDLRFHSDSSFLCIQKIKKLKGTDEAHVEERHLKDKIHCTRDSRLLLPTLVSICWCIHTFAS